MMQFMWRYVDELIGKGLTLDVLAHFVLLCGIDFDSHVLASGYSISLTHYFR